MIRHIGKENADGKADQMLKFRFTVVKTRQEKFLGATKEQEFPTGLHAIGWLLSGVQLMIPNCKVTPFPCQDGHVHFTVQGTYPSGEVIEDEIEVEQVSSSSSGSRPIGFLPSNPDLN